MPVRSFRRSSFQLALLGAVSVVSLAWAGEARAQCVTNNADPASAVVTDGTIVTCTGAVVSQNVQANANQVVVEIAAGANVSGASNIFTIGEQNGVVIEAGGSLTASTIYLLGANSGVFVQGNVDAAGITVDGAGSDLFLDTGSVVTIAPGNLTVLGGPNATSNINLRGTLTGSSSTGSYLLRGGNGQQRVFLSGTVNVQADGLAMNLGDDNDEIYLQAGSVLTGGTNNNILIDGGAGNDRLEIDDSGLSHFSTIGIETLVLDPGAGGFRGLSGSHADVTQFSVASGTVNVTNLAALGQANSNVLIVAGAQLTLSQAGGGNFNHVLAGSGTLALNSAGATYTFGGTGSTFDGTFVIGANNTAVLATSDALGSGTIANAGTLRFGGIEVANTIGGTGQVIVTGSGNSRLSGTNSFSGGLDIQGGVLDVASVVSLGTGVVTSSTSGAVLAVGNTNDEVLANNLTGSLALVKAGAGILDLTGTNSYTLGTLINDGAVRVDDLARLGTGQVIANAGGSLILNYNGAGQLLQLTPFLTGNGAFIKEGSGDVVIDVANSYTGGTTIRAGRIGLNDGDALGTGAIQIDAGAELGVGGIILNNDLTGSGLVRKTASNTVELNGNNLGFAGTIRVEDGDMLVTHGNALGSGTLRIDAGTSVILNAVTDSTVVANLTGDGLFDKAGTGRVTLTGDGTQFAGTIGIQNGILQIAGDQNIGTSPGGVFINAQGTLQLDTAGNTNLATVVYGSGNVIKTGSGTVFMTGANNYSGGTDIQQGAIRVTDVSVLGTGAISVQAGAALDLSVAGAQTLNQNVTGAGILRKSDSGGLTLLSNGLTGGVDIVGGRVIVSTAAALGGGPVTTAADTQLVFDTAGTETIGNSISGAGALTKDGTGTLVIQNANSFTGGTVINAGRLGLNNGQGLGTGSVLVLQGAALSLGGVMVANDISGAGSVIKTASNVGALTGTNTHSGGTFIQGGTLLVDGPDALGTGTVDISAGATLGVDYNGTANVALGNLVTGAGGLLKQGSGTLVINNANSFSGGTQIIAGTVGLNFGTGLGTGAVMVNSGATLAVGDITLANNVGGAGRILKTSAGNTILSGANTHSGGTVVQAGTLTVAGNAPLGTGTVTIASGATLDYAGTTAATFANALAGAGTLRNSGTGQLTFANGFAIGALDLVAGRTRLNAVGTTNVTVGANATLDGTGQIVGNLTNNGTVAPGNSIGTLTVQGNYVHNAGSVLEIEFDGAGNIDLLSVSGTATLNGGTLRFVSLGGAEGSGGTFLTAAGGITGTFATVETVGALLPLAVIYETNRGLMAPSVLTARPSTFNAQSLAAADAGIAFADMVAGQPVTALDGERIWMDGFGSWNSRSASGSTLGYSHDSYGLAGGLNVPVGRRISIGASIGWSSGDIALEQNGGSGEQDILLGSIQARYQAANRFALTAGLLVGAVDQATVRNVSFNGFSATVTGTTESSLFGGFVAASLPLINSDRWHLGADVRGTLVRQSQDGYSEDGTSPLRLTIADIDTTTFQSEARLFAETRLLDRTIGAEESSEMLTLRFDLGGRYLNLAGDRAIPVTFSASNAGIVLSGDGRDGVQALGGVSLAYTTRGGLTARLGYEVESGKSDRHNVRLGVSMRF